MSYESQIPKSTKIVFKCKETFLLLENGKDIYSIQSAISSRLLPAQTIVFLTSQQYNQIKIISYSRISQNSSIRKQISRIILKVPSIPMQKKKKITAVFPSLPMVQTNNPKDFNCAHFSLAK